MKLQSNDFVNVEPVTDDEETFEDVAAEFMVALGSILVFLGAVLLVASW